MPCSNRKFTLQFPRCKFCADKIKSFFLTFKYPILDAPLKWLNNSELRYIPLIAQESNVSSSSTDVLFLVSSNKLPNLRCSQPVVANQRAKSSMCKLRYRIISLNPNQKWYFHINIPITILHFYMIHIYIMDFRNTHCCYNHLSLD